MTSTCRRAGCEFGRERYVRSNGRTVRSSYCGRQCSIWTTRAKAADAAGDAVAAAELLRLADLLDARQNALQQVPGVVRARAVYA